MSILLGGATWQEELEAREAAVGQREQDIDNAVHRAREVRRNSFISNTSQMDFYLKHRKWTPPTPHIPSERRRVETRMCDCL
jgi:hypothetical protein